jgi:hypothetical protein
MEKAFGTKQTDSRDGQMLISPQKASMKRALLDNYYENQGTSLILPSPLT